MVTLMAEAMAEVAATEGAALALYLIQIRLAWRPVTPSRR